MTASYLSMDIMQHFPVISIMILFLGAFLVAVFGRSKAMRVIIVSASVLTSFVLMALLIKPIMIDGQIITYWMGNWAPVDGYAIGIGIEVDALSLFFGLLVAIAVMLSGFYSFKYITQDDSPDKFFTLYLMLAGGVMGIVLSGDLFNIFVMLEVMTFAAVALTSFRSWKDGAREAAFKYLVVGSIGSTCVLLGTALVYAQCHTLNLAQISAIASNDMNPTMIMAFALLFTGFGVKAFMTPFHPIAADAHAAAPSSVSVLISGVFTKTGVYGIIRVSYFLFRSMGMSAMQTGLVFIGCVSMFVCVTMALNQHDFKRLLAFHSISQIGYILTALGLCSALGVVGGLYHAINHTLFKGLLFLVAGSVLYGTGTTYLDKLGGLAKKMPQTAALFMIGALSISGIPPFNGFVSKWMIYQATFEKAAETGSIGYAFVTIICVVTSVLTLASFVKVGQSVFFGELPLELENTKESPLSMRIPMWIMAGLCVLTGVFPNLMQKYLLNPAMESVLHPNIYIDAMLGEGYTAAHLLNQTQLASSSYTFAGYWDPLKWLVLFVIVLLGVFIAMLLGGSSKGTRALARDDKHDTFFGGEKNVYSQVASGDLFWGFKHNFRHYLSFMSNAHSGVTNDYVTWGVVDLAVILVYCFIFM
ncbi:MAG: proton-conducting transporter membrane subunit [Oscillospiraceae bacterium]